MKKVFALFLAGSIVVACNSSGDGKATDETKADSSAQAANTPSQYEEGLEMIGALDCTTCHKISEQNIGPAYTDVAQKYEATEANIDTLAGKIIHGGYGVWGEVPMTPHPDISMDSARMMVKYILSLRK